MAENYITIVEAAKRMNLNKATIYKWMHVLSIKPHVFKGLSKQSYITEAELEHIKEAMEKPWTVEQKPGEAPSPTVASFSLASHLSER